jgi:hypothetical protein
MRETLIEPFVDLFGLLLYTVLSTTFAAEGLVLEQRGLTHLAAHDTGFGLWLVYMGALGLVAGVYLFGYREVLPRLLSGWGRLYEVRWQ